MVSTRSSTLITARRHIRTPAAAQQPGSSTQGRGIAQHPRAAHVDPYSPPAYSSVHPSCRGISPCLQIKAIAFLANIVSSLFSVNIYPHLNKNLLLQPHSRSQRPCNKRIRAWPAYQQRTDTFSLFLAPAAGTGWGEGQHQAAQPSRPTPPTWHLLAGVGESHMLVGGEKLLDQSPQLTQPRAPVTVVTAQEQDVANHPQHLGFPRAL